MPKISGFTPKSSPWLWISIGLGAVFAVLFQLHFIAEAQIAEANQNHMLSALLADELRQSSEDLTRMAHTYVATGNPLYKAHFEEILDIQEGRKPRPVAPDNVYWDPTLKNSERPRPFGPDDSIVRRLHEAGGTAAELAKLKEANHASDELIRMEYRVMELVESESPPSLEMRLKAENLLQNAAYHRYRADIMRPIAEFHAMVEKRTQTAVKQSETRSHVLKLSLLFVAVLLLFSLGRLIYTMMGEKKELLQYRVRLQDLVAERTDALSKSEERFRFIAENSAEVIWTMDLMTQTITYISPSVFQMRGFTPEEVMSTPVSASLTKESWERLLQQLERAAATWNKGDQRNQVQIVEVDQLHKDGHLVPTELVTVLRPDKDGKPAVILGMARDITARVENEAVIRKLAFYDNLTQLANRRLLLDRLNLAVARAAREKNRVALLFIDLDKFKPVNDELGHEVGDRLLRDIAVRIQACVRAYDTPARFGGDEFIVLLPDLKQIDESLHTAERIRSAINTPFFSEEGKQLDISASIGVALYPDHGTNVRDLLRAGDEAMYRAKNDGRNRVQLLASDQLPWRADRTDSVNGTSLRLTWKDNFSSGDPEIDREIRSLFEEVNALLSDTLFIHSQPNVFLENFDRLLSDVRSHFHHEVSLLRDSGYPKTEAHVRRHSALFDRADALAQKVKTETTSIDEIVEFLTVELVADHLLNDDKELSPIS